MNPNLMLLASVGSCQALPRSLKAVPPWGADGTGDRGALHAILAAPKVEKVSADFLGLVQGIPANVSTYCSLQYLESRCM